MKLSLLKYTTIKKINLFPKIEEVSVKNFCEFQAPEKKLVSDYIYYFSL